METMKMVNLSQEEIKEVIVEFNNASRPEEEAFSIELGFNDRTNTFLLWKNAEAIASYKTFKGLLSKAMPIIAANNLEKVS